MKDDDEDEDEDVDKEEEEEEEEEEERAECSSGLFGSGTRLKKEKMCRVGIMLWSTVCTNVRIEEVGCCKEATLSS